MFSSKQNIGFPSVRDELKFNLYIFIRDFAENACFSLSFDYHHPFAVAGDKNKKLYKLLTSQDYDFLEYDLLTLFGFVCRELVINGKVFIEVIKYTDKDGNILGLEFEKINYISYKRFRNYIKFYIPEEFAQYTQSQKNSFSINCENLIELEFPETLMNQRQRRKLIDILQCDYLSLHNSILEDANPFDITIYREQEIIELSKAAGKISWNVPDSTYNYLTDIYFLYRIARFKKAQKQLVEYILKAINDKLVIIGKQLDFEGEITMNSISLEDLLSVENNLLSGGISFKEARRILFKEGNKTS